MSLLKSSKLLKLCMRNNPVAVTAIRNHWNKDYKPGPYPLTEEEWKKAAEKYNLHPSEYKPFPDDGSGHGDYPDLVAESAESRDPFYPWDNPELMRNYNEPMHYEFDLMRNDRYDVNARLNPSLRMQIFHFVAVMGGLWAIHQFFNLFKGFHSVVPKQYPGEGKKHYTFELEQ